MKDDTTKPIGNEENVVTHPLGEDGEI